MFMYLISLMLTVGVGFFIPRFLPFVVVAFAVFNSVKYSRNGQLDFADFKSPALLIAVALTVMLSFTCFYSLEPFTSFWHVGQFGILVIAAAILLISGTKYAPCTLGQPYINIYQIFILVGLSILACLMALLKWKLILLPDFAFNINACALALLYWPVVGVIYRYRHKLFIPVSFLLAVIIVGLSASTTAQLMFGVSGGVYFFFSRVRRSIAADIGFYGLFVSVFVTPLALSYSTQLSDIFEPILKYKTTHFQIWVQSWERIASKWPKGIGIGMSRSDAFAMGERIYGKGQGVMHSHNLPLQFLWELGLLGVVLFLILAILAIVYYRLQHRLFRPIAAAFILSATISFSISYSFWEDWRLACILIGAIYLYHAGCVHGDEEAPSIRS